MRRVVFAVLSACVLLSLGIFSSPAKAGDYYDDSGYYSSHRQRYYDDDSYRSRRSYYDDSYSSRRSSYYDDDGYYSRRRSYYQRPYYSSREYYNERPRQYWSRGYVDDYSASSRYSGYTSCHQRQVPVLDGRGGWVWGVRSSCY